MFWSVAALVGCARCLMADRKGPFCTSPQPEWKQVSHEAKALVKQMMNLVAEKRPTAAEVCPLPGPLCRWCIAQLGGTHTCQDACVHVLTPAKHLCDTCCHHPKVVVTLGHVVCVGGGGGADFCSRDPPPSPRTPCGPEPLPSCPLLHVHTCTRRVSVRARSAVNFSRF